MSSTKFSDIILTFKYLVFSINKRDGKESIKISLDHKNIFIYLLEPNFTYAYTYNNITNFK